VVQRCEILILRERSNIRVRLGLVVVVVVVVVRFEMSGMIMNREIMQTFRLCIRQSMLLED